MRLTLAFALAGGLTFAACSGGDSDSDSDTDIVDTGDTGSSSADRLGVPEQYKLLWNTTDGCDPGDGTSGTQVYWHTDDAESVEQGENVFFTATETWYWFHGGDGSQDCKDEWTITGRYVNIDYDQLGCAGCEEGYSFERTLKNQGCSYQYHQIFGYQDGQEAPDPQEYDGYLLMDTHTTFNGSPNEDNKMLMVARYRTPGGFSLNNNYGLPGMSKRNVSDPDRQGPPGNYEWAGSACLGGGGGGT
ncbi:MAG: hypothetical protein AB8H79_17750 [Myxococcota bacterium]